VNLRKDHYLFADHREIGQCLILLREPGGVGGVRFSASGLRCQGVVAAGCWERPVLLLMKVVPRVWLQAAGNGLLPHVMKVLLACWFCPRRCLAARLGVVHLGRAGCGPWLSLLCLNGLLCQGVVEAGCWERPVLLLMKVVPRVLLQAAGNGLLPHVMKVLPVVRSDSPLICHSRRNSAFDMCVTFGKG
jgi:hypothetical protein